jgi:ferredoxin-NADP reductase
MSTTDAAPRLLTAAVTRVTPCTPHAWHVVMRPDDGECRFQAGQAMAIAKRGIEPRRPYSIASAPADLERDGTLEFLVAVGADGQPGDHLARLRVEELVDLEGPVGRFTLDAPEPGADLVFFAGGTGIAPLRSMWRQALARVEGVGLTVVYSARTQAHVAFADELASLEHEGRARVAITLTREPASTAWRGRRGRVDGPLVASVVDPRRSLAFVCGPPAFVDHMRERLREAGVDPARTRHEGW